MANETETAPVTWQQIADQPVPPSGQRIAYGADSQQFGELRLPPGNGPHPVVILLHGGCWRAEYDLQHIAPVADALTRAGIATWTVEYRRIGNAGGAWPGTFDDVAAAADHLRRLADEHHLDLTRVVAAGHSAGGHLALWLAARRNLPSSSERFRPNPLPIVGVVGLAAISDLRTYSAGSGNCNAAVAELLGGLPAERPERYSEASPLELLPFHTPVRLVHGTGDAIVPIAQSEQFAAHAIALGDDARVIRVDGAGHFDVIAPFAPAWPTVLAAVRSLLDPVKQRQ